MSFKQLERQLNNLEKRALATNERLAKVDASLESIDENLAEHMRRTELLEEQTRDLQSFKNKALGAVALLLFLLTVADKVIALLP